jgi:hypothetical protein
MKDQDVLIYDLIFSEKNRFKIDIGDYIKDVYDHQDFVSNMRKILKRAKVSIVESEIVVDSKSVTWLLKVKK